MKRKNYTGMVFGRLTVIKETRTINKRRYALCECSCGTIKEIRITNLIGGGTVSCGCYQKENMSKKKGENSNSYKHGKSNTRLNKVYRSMKNRCYNKNDKSYINYGGRGIRICDEWLNDFLIFEKWAYKNGYDENAKYGECTIDRIDVNGNYEPSNCRWVNMKLQCINRRKRKTKYDLSCLKKIEFIADLSIKEIAEKLNISVRNVKYILEFYNTNLNELRKKKRGYNETFSKNMG